MRHHLAVAALLTLTGSLAHAAPARRGKQGQKTQVKAPPMDDDDDDDDGDRADDADSANEDEDDDEDEAPRKKAPRKSVKKPARKKSDQVAVRSARTDADDDDDGDEREDAVAPVRLRAQHDKKAKKAWHVAIGPYLWASSVDAQVSLGPASVSAGVDFIETQRHARYGAEVLAEARYGKLAIYTDFMYGVVDVDGATDVGPLSVMLAGTASSLLVDGFVGYRLLGDVDSLLSLEARGGVRYQRTSIAGSVEVSGNNVSPPEYVDAASDGLAGAQVTLRPSRRFALSSTVDLGVFGASTNTWSAAADASVRITSHVLFSLGYRTLTTERANVHLVMHGPRAALQVLF
ncbi:MAG: hypothetical protein KF773_21560 [Deltaproteobacteria bacterium]|nr:hypothetical protein [Deltaproteobacteria bacterium]